LKRRPGARLKPDGCRRAGFAGGHEHGASSEEIGKLRISCNGRWLTTHRVLFEKMPNNGADLGGLDSQGMS